MPQCLALKSQGFCISFVTLQSIHSTGLSEPLRIRSKGLKTTKLNQRHFSFQDLATRLQSRPQGRFLMSPHSIMRGARLLRPAAAATEDISMETKTLGKGACATSCLSPRCGCLSGQHSLSAKGV